MLSNDNADRSLRSQVSSTAQPAPVFRVTILLAEDL